MSHGTFETQTQYQHVAIIPSQPESQIFKLILKLYEYVQYKVYTPSKLVSTRTSILNKCTHTVYLYTSIIRKINKKPRRRNKIFVQEDTISVAGASEQALGLLSVEMSVETRQVNRADRGEHLRRRRLADLSPEPPVKWNAVPMRLKRLKERSFWRPTATSARSYAE